MRAKNIGKADESTQEKMDKGRYRTHFVIRTHIDLVSYLFLIFPCSVLLLHLSSISWHRADMDLYTICSIVTGRGLATLNTSFRPMLFLCCFATPFSTTLYLSLSVPVLR